MSDNVLPLFSPGLDPGPSFADLLRKVAPAPAPRAQCSAARGAPLEVAHGTTVLAIRFAGGVVMAGDRRATAGYTIASRRIEKVFPADDFSGVAIAGAAGPAVEMVKLFQVQLEHYEKVQGDVLSLEGKANQLGQLVRANLPAAMQGFVGRAAVRGLRRSARPTAASSPTTSPAAATRRSTTRPRVRAASTPATGSRAGWREGMPVDEVDRPRDQGAVRGGRRGRRHRRTRPRARHLPDGRRHRRRPLPRARPTPRSPQRSQALLQGPERGGDTA